MVSRNLFIVGVLSISVIASLYLVSLYPGVRQAPPIPAHILPVSSITGGWTPLLFAPGSEIVDDNVERSLIATSQRHQPVQIITCQTDNAMIDDNRTLNVVRDLRLADKNINIVRMSVDQCDFGATSAFVVKSAIKLMLLDAGKSTAS
jgi:hypothetical protein